LMERSVIVFDVAELQALPALPTTRGCDFCATGTPSWRYPAHNVGLGVLLHGDVVLRPISIGGWRACHGCSELIEQGDYPGLARRTLRSLDLDLSKSGPGVRVRMLATFHHAHEQFRCARTGEREAVS
jgi:hypothetical protein